MTMDPSPGVLQPWSRAAEWGPTLLVLGSWSAAVLLLVYFALGAEAYGLAMMLLIAGCVGAAILSYPILITLERPVRSHAGAGRSGLLRRPVASPAAPPPDVAACSSPGDGSHPMFRLLRGFQELLEHERSASSARGMPDRSLRWSSWSRTSAPRRAAGRPRSTRTFKVKVFVRGRRGRGPDLEPRRRAELRARARRTCGTLTTGPWPTGPNPSVSAPEA